jgi:4-hydroxyphenylpyruvate dioxygenase
LALWVDDARSAYEETMKRGATSYQEPQVLEDANGRVVTSGIYTWGETAHLFVERKIITVRFCPDMKRGHRIINRLKPAYCMLTIV